MPDTLIIYGWWGGQLGIQVCIKQKYKIHVHYDKDKKIMIIFSLPVKLQKAKFQLTKIILPEDTH